MKVTDEMVNRFLAWPLPKDFGPDGGIKFTPINHPACWPVGTNLFTADQARQMLEHVLGSAKSETVSTELDAAATYLAKELPEGWTWEFSNITNPHHGARPMGPGIGVTLRAPNSDLHWQGVFEKDKSALKAAQRAVPRMRRRISGERGA